MRLELLSASWDKLCLREHVILWQSAAIMPQSSPWLMMSLRARSLQLIE